MAFAKHIGKKKIFFNVHGEGSSTFLNLGSSQIIKKKIRKNTRKKTPLNAISDAQF
jgi:hypothetical protein